MQIKSKVMLCLVIAVCCWPFFKVYGKADDWLELPVIAVWKNGNGYTEDGMLIRGTWAYDAVNPAGKYVLFGDDGMPLLKSDQWENRNDMEENYTGTDRELAVISLRAEIFPEFQGVIQVTLEEKSGLELCYELDTNNQYSFNADVASGDYVVKMAQAYDDTYIYRTTFPSDQYHIQNSDVLVVDIQVAEERTGRVETMDAQQAEVETDTEMATKTEPESEAGNYAEAGLPKENESVGKPEGKAMEALWILCGIVLMICAAGYCVSRKEKNIYQ